MQQLKQAISESPPRKIEESAQPSNQGQGMTGHDIEFDLMCNEHQ